VKVSRWIVSNVPAWLVLLILVVVIAGGAVLVQKVLRHRYPGLAGDAHNDATRFASGTICFVYAFFIGFIASALWNQINSEDDQVQTEGAAAIQLVRDSTVFDKPDGDRIRQALTDYESAALAEWPALGSGGGASRDADTALHRVYLAYQQAQTPTDIQKTFLATSLGNLDKVSQARTARMIRSQTDAGPPWSIWVLILLTSALVLGCAIIYGVEDPRIHSAMVATVGVLVAVDLFLILELAHPYIGEIATSSQPLRDVITALSAPTT
jgi:hypothetical protein